MRSPFRTPILVAAAVLLATASLSHAQANFAGTWVLDRSQSQLAAPQPGAGPAQPSDVKLTVQQDGDVVKVTRTVTVRNTERSISESYTTDGSPHTFTGRRNSTVVTKAAWDGPRLVLSSTRTRPSRSGGGDVQVSRESVLSLSPDGRTLTIQTTMHRPRGDRTLTSVYQRT